MGRASLTIAALALAATVACSGSSDDSTDAPSTASDAASDDAGRGAADELLDELDGLDADARRERLLALADDEDGQLTLYSSMAPDLVNRVVEAFEDEFDLDVELFRTDSEGLIQRVNEEADAGVDGPDVIEAAALLVETLDDDLLARFRSPAQDGLRDGSVAPRWTADALDIFVATWNTELVADADRPSSWEELAGDEWSGRLVVEAQDIEWYAGLRQHWVAEGRTEEEADELMARIGSNARIVKGHSLMTQLLSAGEFDVAVSPFLHQVRGAMDEGAPIRWEPALEPLIGRPSAVAVASRSTSPAKAVLFADWLLSDGQSVIAELGSTPTRGDQSGLGDTEVLIVDVRELATSYDDWRARYERIVATGDPIEG